MLHASSCIQASRHLHQRGFVPYAGAMATNSMKRTVRAAGLALALALMSIPAAIAAENLDAPTLLAAKPLAGASSQSGVINKTVGFPAHVYTANKDGMVKVVMRTTNVTASDNGGIAWRPYVRVLSQPNANRSGEAWSSNGYQTGASAEAELVFRVTKGEKFTVIATLALHTLGSTRANANYTITVKE
jgi:hypothetical protein